MLQLMISPTSPDLTRRGFLFNAATVSALALTTSVSAASALGFRTLPAVTGYTATPGRFRRAATGFVRCAANEERLCFNANGSFRGQYLQGADTYLSAPWDDTAAPHTSSDPAFLTTSTGGTIAYAGAHTEADIFGTAGKGAVITQTATAGGFHAANNIAVTGLAAGDLMRFHAILSITGATGAGEVTLGTSTNSTNIHVFQHDASGNIVGQTESWNSRRAGFFDMGTINGKRWWYLWVDAVASTTANAIFRIGFGSSGAQAGKKYHICELMGQRNPATAPAAVPVCAVNKVFAADTLATGLTNVGYVMNGLALARSQTATGAIFPPSVNIGVPYEPLETRIDIVRSAETGDRAGILPNPNQLLYGRPWRSPANHSLTFGPGWFVRDWYKGSGAGEAATNVIVRSVFQAREDMHAILGNMETSPTYLLGSLDI
ncbi:MAG TPA: hypothetical protein VI407_07580, partial [Erythrobacter sp.]